MRFVRLGRTGLHVSKVAFGALPIQRVSFEDAARILKHAYENGVNFFDTANAYTDSEEKIGHALSHVRDNIFIATKSTTESAEDVSENIDLSLKRMKTDYIDIFQFHNPGEFPDDKMLKSVTRAKEQGKIRFIGITSHKLDLAHRAVDSGIFDTLQFPFSLLSNEDEIKLVKKCVEKDVGFIAMKALSGGLITSSKAAFAFMDLFPSVVPIYGIQKMSELAEFLELEKNPPVMDEKLSCLIESQREGLSEDFCRACGYCMPCPEGIEIWQCARISLLIGRAPYQQFINEEWRANMDKIKNCRDCGLCAQRCPYGLDTPRLLKRELGRYDKLYEKLKD